MKNRIIAAVLCGLIAAGLTGCGNTAEKERQPSSSMVQADGTSGNETSGDMSAVPSAPAESENPADSAPQIQPQTEKTEGQTKPPAQTEEKTNSVLSTPPPAESHTQKPKPTELVKPAKPTESETPPPEPEKPTEPTEPPAPEFNIDDWVSYGKRYAQSIGLELDKEAVECWDTPITAGAHCIYLERDIQGRLNRYNRDEDITAVWIWAEPRADGDYDLYIGYA